jgi:hypothetical protein
MSTQGFVDDTDELAGNGFVLAREDVAATAMNPPPSSDFLAGVCDKVAGSLNHLAEDTAQNNGSKPVVQLISGRLKDEEFPMKNISEVIMDVGEPGGGDEIRSMPSLDALREPSVCIGRHGHGHGHGIFILATQPEGRGGGGVGLGVNIP